MAITYSISGGADAAKFNIDPATGALTFKAKPDFETPGSAAGTNTYSLQVKATDPGGASSVQDMTVNVTDVNEVVVNQPPNFTSPKAMSMAENTLAAGTVVAVDPDAGGPVDPPPGGGTPLPPLVASGSITVSANNQVVENKLITGKILCEGKSGVIIRNCWIKHPGGIGLETLNCTNLTIEDVKVEDTIHPTGQKPHTSEVKNIQLQQGGPFYLKRVTVSNGCGIYAYQTTGRINISFLEGHNSRGQLERYRGQLIQCNQISGGLTMEDFSNENDPQDSWAEDNISLHQNNTSANNIIIRRGLLDGNNSKTGVGVMCEVGTNGVLVEDVDVVHQGNGAFSAYSSTHNCTFRRCRVKDTIQKDQGRGVPTSNYLSFCSTPDCSGTKFEQVKYWNVKEDNLAYDTGTMVTRDWAKADFTPRSPIRNRTPGT